MKKTAKQRRDLLFKEGHIEIRSAQYADLRWTWVAAKMGGYEGPAEDFTDKMEAFLADADSVWIIEDRNSKFERGAGPIGLVLANFDGWSLVPHAVWFPWASDRNILRGTVGWLQSYRNNRDVGVIKVTCTDAEVDTYKRLKSYLAIRYVGKIPGGRETGVEHLFYLRGRKNVSRKSNRRSKTEGPVQSGSDPEAAGGTDRSIDRPV